VLTQAQNLSPQERAAHFSTVFPAYAPLVVHNNRLYGTWLIGALFGHKSTFYGQFPYRLKDRILALFPDDENIVHLCSGTIHDRGTVTYDINPSLHPTICDDVRNVKNHRAIFRLADLVVCDPPYGKGDFAKYGQEPFNKAQLIRDLGSIMGPGSHLAWLDLMVPIYNKKTWNLLGHVGIVVSTNTRVRMLSLFEHV
jgi:hypothetical protein